MVSVEQERDPGGLADEGVCPTIFQLLQACLGLAVDGAEHKIILSNPAFPVELDQLNIRDLPVGKAVVDLNLFRHGDAIAVTVFRKVGQIEAIVQHSSR